MDNNNKNNKGIALVVALIAAASMFSLGAIAAPAYAGGDDGVKQKAESEADCDQKNKVEDGIENSQSNNFNTCAAISANAIDDGSLLLELLFTIRD